MKLFFKYKDYTNKELNDALIESCVSGSLEDVKHLILKEHANINVEFDCPFRMACTYGHLDIVRFLLKPFDLILVDPHASNEAGLRSACEHERINVVEYLLTSKELKVPVNIHANENMAFKRALENKSYDLLNYLIFDYGIDKTEDIKKCLVGEEEFKKQINHMFDMRQINNSLIHNLSEEKTINKQYKI